MKKGLLLLIVILVTLTYCSSGEEDTRKSKETGESAAEVIKGYAKTLSTAKDKAREASDMLTRHLEEQEKALEEASR